MNKEVNRLENGKKPNGCYSEKCRCMERHGRIIKSCKWRIKDNLLRRDEWDKDNPTMEQKKIVEKTARAKLRNNNNPLSVCKRCGKLRNVGDDRCKCKRGKAGQLL